MQIKELKSLLMCIGLYIIGFVFFYIITIYSSNQY